MHHSFYIYLQPGKNSSVIELHSMYQLLPWRQKVYSTSISEALTGRRVLRLQMGKLARQNWVYSIVTCQCLNSLLRKNTLVDVLDSSRQPSSAQVATAIRGAIILAKMSVVPVRRGYWGNKIGAPHTVPTKVTGKCGSVIVRLIPAPRGAGIVAARVPKKVLSMAGIEDVYTCSRGSTKTLGNFVKVSFLAFQFSKTAGLTSRANLAVASLLE